MEGNETREVLLIKKKQSAVGSKSFLVILTAALSVFATLMVIYFVNDGIIFVGATRYGDLRKAYGVSEVIYNIEENYYPYNGDMPTDEEMATTAMKAIVDSLGDTYAQYFTAEEYETYVKSVNSEFKGIGITIRELEDIGTVIVKVYEDSPAKKAGLAEGDIIKSVNGTDVSSMSVEEITQLIRSADSDSVNLIVLRDSEYISKTVYFGEIHIPTMYYKTIDNSVGYIMITQFAEKTGTEFATALELLQDKAVSSLIIDVRNNPGGYLTTVVDIADQLLDEGVIVSIGNDDASSRTEFRAKKGGVDLPIVILINENSASASEILAAAIKENKAGTLIGMQTYGKGIVQTTAELYSTDGRIKITTDAYYTPNGNNIHKIGVSPDVYSDLPDNKKPYVGTESLSDEEDSQLQRALKWIGENSVR